MILKNKFLFILLLIPLSFNGLSQNLKPTFSLNGYVKYLPAYMDYSFFESENNHLIHNRVNHYKYIVLLTPIFVYLLLTRVSGVNLLEEIGEKRWGDSKEYQKYKEKTPLFFPKLF